MSSNKHRTCFSDSSFLVVGIEEGDTMDNKLFTKDENDLWRTLSVLSRVQWLETVVIMLKEKERNKKKRGFYTFSDIVVHRLH